MARGFRQGAPSETLDRTERAKHLRAMFEALMAKGAELLPPELRRDAGGGSALGTFGRRAPPDWARRVSAPWRTARERAAAVLEAWARLMAARRQ